MMPNLVTTGAVVWKCIMTDKHSLFFMRKKKEVKVKLTLYQAVKAHRVVRH
jgi:hypothetical protein